MILEVTGDQIAQLNDTDLRTLVAYLCEREVKARGHSTSTVTWGGHQNAGDGGIDVRVALPAGAAISGYVPKPETGFQVKAQDMSRAAILKEMSPEGTVLPSITQLVANGGAYVIVSSQGSTADKPLKDRKAAMAEAVKGLAGASPFTVEFYDRRRIASWVNQHVGLVPWVREKLGLPLSGWHPFGDWSSSPTSLDAPYLLDAQTRLVGPSIPKDSEGLNAEHALALLREKLTAPKGVVRLVGLSGVGKTRLIQALFDERIGAVALSKMDALYTDFSDGPDPEPLEMLSRLINLGHRVVLIVDNCSIELHRKIAARVSNSNCPLSVITVEYDINDDEPQNTDIFKLEPASSDLIEKVLEIRYAGIAAPSRSVIARFSEGNARVAFALAETAKNGESLAQLNDTELFERLFHQSKGSSPELLDAAKVCALLYSFDGETLDGGESALAVLAALAGQTVDQIHKHVAELLRRQLVQKRSKWRAILPHALANRLAKRALEDIPLKRIEDGIVEGTSAHMLRSFSRRIGYLHGHAHAVGLATKWLSSGGLLAGLGQLDDPHEDIFQNVAPVDPPATLAFIEKIAAANESWFFSDQNRNKTPIIHTLRSLAYEPALFERSALLLRRFAKTEVEGIDAVALEPLKSFFWLYLSGTHATTEQRATLIRTLLESGIADDQSLGLILLGEMLTTSNFSSHHSFEFGAWKRDFGFFPASSAQIRHWYSHAIETARLAASSGKIPAGRVHHVMATHIPQLLSSGLYDEIISVADFFAGNGGWPEGWIGVRIALRRGKGKIPAAIVQKLEALEERLRPGDLAGMIRSYVLTPEWGALDVGNFDEDDDDLSDARQRLYDLCTDLGQQLAANKPLFDAMLPEIVVVGSQKTLAFGRGLATGCESITDCWAQLRDEFLKVIPAEARSQIISGFFWGATEESPETTESLLDEVLLDPRLHPYFINLQTSATVNARAFDRLMKAAMLETVPIDSFYSLSGGRLHAGLNDDQLRELLRAIMTRKGGGSVAMQILGMRVFGNRADKLPISESLRATGREFLSNIELVKNARLDHMAAEIVSAAFDKPEYEDQARAFCEKIIAALKTWTLYRWDVAEIVAAITKAYPVVVLDMFVEQAAGDNGTGTTIFQDVRSNRPCPLEHMPEDAWIGWAEQKPQTRYELLAKAVRFSPVADDDPAKGWTPSALKIIDTAPDAEKILDTFYARFRPNGWGGSLADTLASRAPLLEELKSHGKPEIAAWANKRAPEFSAYVAQIRARETDESRQRHQAFE